MSGGGCGAPGTRRLIPVMVDRPDEKPSDDELVVGVVTEPCGFMEYVRSWYIPGRPGT
jgi:hypothetical protein